MDKIEGFFSSFPQVEYNAREIIIRSEDQPQGIYYLKDGFVKMNSLLEDGKDLTVNIYKSGSYFPMIWAISDIPNRYNYIAMSKVTTFKAPKENLLNFLNNNKEIYKDLVRRVLIGVDGLLVNIENLLVGKTTVRVISALLLLVRRFGNINKNGEIVIAIPLTHQDIANLAGITRESASIILKKLKDEKVLTQKGRYITICNAKALFIKKSIPLSNSHSPSSI